MRADERADGLVQAALTVLDRFEPPDQERAGRIVRNWRKSRRMSSVIGIRQWAGAHWSAWAFTAWAGRGAEEGPLVHPAHCGTAEGVPAGEAAAEEG
ncbi:hypothetical protein ACFWUZ_24640 [Streptomyces sp. NPDC058646]|uniref:hypothetical protein n=1 Tax=Streptomyces sp. NPDC058646 TaxID=3346574 RepID=UPI003657B581